MKKNLGSIILLLLITVSLQASSLCDYDFKVSNHSPFIKESVEIIFEVEQKDKSGVMFFELTPHKSKNFELHLMGNSENKKSYHDNTATYRYILFPLKSGEIKLEFDLKVSLATDESVEKFYTGNRDVINPMAAKVTMLEIEPLKLDVKSLKKNVDFIGDFELDFKIGKKEVKSYEQLNISYKLSGHGYIPQLKSILPKIDSVESFLEKTGKEKDFIKKGVLLFRYALLSSKDFEIPHINIKCFSPKKGRYYTLKTLQQKIIVIEQNSEILLDNKNNYPTTAFEWSTLLPYLNGFLLFISGFIIAKLNLLQYLKRKKMIQNPMLDKIEKAKDKKGLLQILLSSNKIKYQAIIKQLEASIYENKKCDLKKVKEKLSNL